ncbi:MAG: ComEA family DNA-binding protein [Pseudomonadota bacterium]
MRFFNLGNKDEYGRQTRIEHRGRYLRASRTGGVALRARARAAGVNVTANTSRGFRVSATPLKNTQIAMQNGRFVLRGRYGRGPTKLNLSKTGATVSTRNALGSFNWIKPKRSSAKIAGVQLRGENAAILQAVYMAVMAAVLLLQGALWLLAVLLQGAVALGALLYRLALTTPYALSVVKRRWRNWRLNHLVKDTDALFQPPVSQWSARHCVAGLMLALAGWGRGHDPEDAVVTVLQALGALEQTEALLAATPAILPEVAQSLSAVRQNDQTVTESDDKTSDPRTIVALLARQIRGHCAPQETAEILMEIDEITLADGERTVLQNLLIQIAADFAGLRFEEPENDPKANDIEGNTANRQGAINLNTAPLQTLETLPHLGPERAQALIDLRPIESLDQLTQIDGIGPGRLQDIRDSGVYW